MKKFFTATLLLIVILGVVAIFYLDILDIRHGQYSAPAEIIVAEDKREVTDELLENTAHPDQDIRARAALALGRIADPDYMDILFDLTGDSSLNVAQTAFFAIGLAGDSGDALTIIDNLDSLRPETLPEAIEAVGHLGHSTLNNPPAFLEFYLKSPDPRTRRAAASAIWRTGLKKAWPALVEICYNDSVPAVATDALYALVMMKIAEPVDLYSKMYAAGDPFVRLLAMRGLALSGKSARVSNIAFGLNDRNAGVVAAAISSLAAVNTPEASDYLKNKYLDETDSKLKALLLRSLRGKADSPIEKTALNDIEDDSAPVNIREESIFYLATTRDQKILPLIDSLGADAGHYLKTALVRALGEIAGPKVYPRLAAYLEDKDADVRAAAFTELCRVDSANIDYYFQKALNDSDFVVQVYAVEKIGQMQKTEFIPELLKIMESSFKHEVDLRRAAIDAAGKLLNDKGTAGAEEIIRLGIHDTHYLVNRDAARVYHDKIDADTSFEPSRPYGAISKSKAKSLLAEYEKNPRATILTDKGEIDLELYFDIAPLTVGNFIKLAGSGFYDNLTFHRVIPAFVVQGGDPRGDGWGGPGYNIRCEYSDMPFKRGTIGIAHSGKDSGGSQFFITLTPQPHLESKYTIFGRVTSGMDAVDKIVRGDTILTIRILESPDKEK